MSRDINGQVRDNTKCSRNEIEYTCTATDPTIHQVLNEDNSIEDGLCPINSCNKGTNEAALVNSIDTVCNTLVAESETMSTLLDSVLGQTGFVLFLTKVSI